MNNLVQGQVKILVVEDENIVALDIERGLKRLGYAVLAVVSNGRDAIRSARLLQPDLILMDIQLKGDLDGIQTANEIREAYNIPVVFLTAYADEATLQRAKSAEPYGYLLKPFEETELHTAIEVILQKHRAFEERQEKFAKDLILSEQRFKLFVDSIEDYGIFLLDSNGYVVSWNDGAQRINGYGAVEIIGKNFSVFYTDEDIKAGKPQVQLAMATQTGSCIEENWRVRKDGSRFWASVVLSAIRDANGKLLGLGKVTRDLTLKKQTEEMMLKSIEARDEFLSIASHELKTPLSVLKLHLQMSRRAIQNIDQLSTVSIEKSLVSALKQVDSLTKLIEDLLDVSRIQTGRLVLSLERANLSNIIRDVVERFASNLAIAKVSVELQLEENIVGYCDAHRFEQILVNLLSNIIKYAPGTKAWISAESKNGKMRLVVQDFGPGIPLDKQEKIFERFERAVVGTNISGLGLGLFVVKKIVEAHKGTVALESALGQGARFSIDLPLSLPVQNHFTETARYMNAFEGALPTVGR